ncbi:hypothetical protein HG537_0H04490 [Torulaspora globosa]|uniref:SAC domain-containing protein n=1 Tax=Torulaspora globosa TaxID=48254 RepID=A0A7H9I1G5_9SACH|nr:hypothetical protein HG537_0H04490 [Torulaspora sp. CBS 2947]
MAGPLLYSRTSEGLVFKCASVTEKSDTVIQLSCQDQNVSLVGLEEFPLHGKIKKIAALLGFIKLKLNRYAIIADRVEETGRLNRHVVYKVVNYSIVPVKLNGRVDSDESEYLKLLELHLNNATLYFSYSYDLTNSLQRNEQIGGVSWKTADTRFFWNYYLTEDLRNLASTESRVSDFIQPVIYGYAKTVDRVLNSVPITVGLITRRSRFRAGTRYFRRGIDEDGNVGNFNETEQILVVQGLRNDNIQEFSFLQTRGSVPVYWAEINNLKYKPSLVIGEQSSLNAAKRHFDEQKKLYGDNYLVNLVNQSGHEQPVKDAYESAVHALNDPKLHYIYFDFHHECRKMRWYRVKLLIDHLKDMGLKKTDFFHVVKSPNGETIKIVNEQTSVVRTNCMDCLDRTNVVQSVLAHWVLQEELEKAGVITNGAAWEEDVQLLSTFQSFWADNADAVSCSYSGTSALKTDFTRTGKRTRSGAFKDFINSASRYYQNNLSDGPRQDSYDLILGNFKPYMSSIQSPFPDRRPLYIQFMPTVMYAALTVLAATIVFPKEHFSSSKNLTFFLSAAIILIIAARFLIQNGLQYVNWPKLVDVGFVVAQQTHNKEKEFKGLKYVPSSKFTKPNGGKKD